jgi:hypothetical protein
LSDEGLAGGLKRIFIPDASWVRERYVLRHNPPLVYCYVNRLVDLARRRFA